MKNPYNKTILFKSGFELKNRDHRIWEEGYNAGLEDGRSGHPSKQCPICHCDMSVWKELFGEDHTCYSEEIVDSSMAEEWIDPDTFVYRGVEYTITPSFEAV